MTDTSQLQLVERLREEARKEAEADRLLTDARYGKHYASIRASQTTRWEAADLIEAQQAEIERLQSKLDRLSLPGGEEAGAAILGAQMVLEGKATNATDCLKDAQWKPSRVHIEGMRNVMNEALEYLKEARASLSQPRPEPSMDDVGLDRLRVEHHVEQKGNRKQEWWELRTPTGGYLATCCDEDIANQLAARAAIQSLPQAGEREATILREAVKPWADYHGDLPDYDHPLRPVYESGIQYAVNLLAKDLGVEDYEICEGTEEFDGDLGGTLMNIVLAALPKDEHGDPIHPRELRSVIGAELTEKILAWLRKEAKEGCFLVGWSSPAWLADRIEQGAHLTQPAEGER